MVDLSPAPSVASELTDDGSASPAFVAAVAARARGELGIRHITRILRETRLLVPLLEVSGDELEASDADPCAGQDRAVAAVSLRTPAGVVGLAFTSVAQLARWNPQARPWPTPAPRVAAALLAEGGVRLVVDAVSSGCIELTGVPLRRLATGEDWPEPWEDPAVRAALVDELAPVLASGELGVRLACPVGTEGTPPPANGLLLELAFPAGTPADVAEQRARVVARRLGGNAALREVFDGTLEIATTTREPALG
jgi:hypothetical protein